MAGKRSVMSYRERRGVFSRFYKTILVCTSGGLASPPTENKNQPEKQGILTFLKKSLAFVSVFVYICVKLIEKRKFLKLNEQ